MQLLRTILIIVLVYYVLKILARIFGPSLFKYASKKAEKRFNEQFNKQQQYRNQNVNEGEVTIEKKPSTKSKSANKLGEYIDFEEIDDTNKA
ncbi:DUF4834 family protein [Ascidiimonas sp. W6]|uniref:DUF4834 family protein n=1 Tax=Ascidiimonas meishanensis TaxID=3128903 RepID=UPI0030ECD600